MERIIAISSSRFQAVDAGQMSMFGRETGLEERIELPDTPAKISRRAQLDWEKELIGLYVSDHPLSTVIDTLKQNVTYFAQELGEANHHERVTVAGMVTHIRHHQTKNGKPMAFVTIEDIQGTIDLVIFPSVWKKVAELIQFDKIICATGRVDSQRGEPKILVNRITTQLQPAESERDLPNDEKQQPREKRSQPKEEKSGTNQKPPVREPSPEEVVSGAKSSPPAPDPFPREWKEEEHQGSDPSSGKPEIKTPTEKEKNTQGSNPASPGGPGLERTQEGQNTQSYPEEENGQSPSQKPPLDFEEDSDYMVTIILKQDGDKLRDKLRLRQIYGTLISYPGEDQFAFQIIENDQSHLLEFPNATTKLSQDLLTALQELIGEENVQVEKLSYS
jgi:DNA polymerase-3 subunit alpha